MRTVQRSAKNPYLSCSFNHVDLHCLFANVVVRANIKCMLIVSIQDEDEAGGAAGGGVDEVGSN